MYPQSAQCLRRFLPALIFIFISTSAFAGAWLQPQGKGQFILNSYYTTSNEFFNAQGRRQSQSRYVKYELNPYLEYGLSNRLTVGANVLLQRASQSTITNYGIGDSEFFARMPLWESGNFMLSASPLIKLPGIDRSSNRPKIGSTHPDVGLGLAAGYGFEMAGRHHFAEADTEYRYRFGTPEDQIKLTATLGWSLSDRWTILPQAFATFRAKQPQTVVFTQSSGDDYNLIKLQCSAVYKLNERTSLQFGGFMDVDGKNSGIGQGALLSLWRSF